MDEKIKAESKQLYKDIDSCITELINARANKDTNAEGKALFRMEGLVVGTLQHLACIIESSENIGQLNELLIPAKPSEDLEEAAEKWCKENCRGFVLRDKSAYYVGECIPAFIAGWKACKEKMIKEAVEGVAEELYNDGESQCTVGVGTYFKPGEEVYVIKKEDEK